MTAVAELLDKAKEARGIPSDNAFAVSLGWRRQVISQWRNGESYPSEDHIAQLADIAHSDAVPWLVRVKAERTDGAAGKAWARLARQLGVAATLAAVTLMGLPSEAYAASNAYYVKWRARLFPSRNHRQCTTPALATA